MRKLMNCFYNQTVDKGLSLKGKKITTHQCFSAPNPIPHSNKIFVRKTQQPMPCSPLAGATGNIGISL